MARLDLTVPFDLHARKEVWLIALDEAEAFARSRPAEEIGCLYFSRANHRFEVPRPDAGLDAQGLTPHFGTPGGVLPRPTDERVRH